MCQGDNVDNLRINSTITLPMGQGRFITHSNLALEVKTMADLKIGDVAPDFTAPGVITKPEVQRIEIKLSDYRGKKNVVLAFHPFAFTAL
jgi:hypothetical protein